KDVAELLQIAEMSAKNTCNYYIDLESFPFDTLTEQQRDRFNLILISCIAFRSFNIQTGFDVKRYLSLSAKELYKSIGFDVESYVTLEEALLKK
ncbi:MAG: hypothetical protein EBZ47_09175, partial [Chlamydiae bacterium]|nr:hypothetical protein [Chlamydiota bacterium]